MSHVDKQEMNILINHLKESHEDKDIGLMTMHQGMNHDCLSMILGCSEKRKVMMDMKEHVEKMLKHSCRVVQECEYFGVVWCGVCGVLCAVRGGGSTGGVMQESDAVSITAWPLVKNYLAADGRVVQECKEWIAVSCRKTRCVLCVVC